MYMGFVAHCSWAYKSATQGTIGRFPYVGFILLIF